MSGGLAEDDSNEARRSVLALSAFLQGEGGCRAGQHGKKEWSSCSHALPQLMSTVDLCCGVLHTDMTSQQLASQRADLQIEKHMHGASSHCV
eukprot:4453521-Amphidinium_carterae.1